MKSCTNKKGGTLLASEQRNPVEVACDLLLSGLTSVEKAMDISYLESYVELIASYLEDATEEKTVDKNLQDIFSKVSALNLTKEERRKVSQLLLLKASKEDKLSANHQLTPDAIGYLFVFLLEQFLKNKTQLSILDPACGMGNLLATVENALELSGKKVSGVGVENDDLLIEIAAVNSEWFEQNAQFFHQDAMQGLLTDPKDIVVSDLPIGYYPQDDRAKDFQVAKDITGHTYAHHLMIESSFSYLKEGGLGLYLVPNNLFSSEQGVNMLNWIKKETYFQGLISLPKDLFLNESSQKAILLLQKPGENAKQAKEVLLAQMGSLKKPQEMQKFMGEFTNWYQENLSE